MRARDESRRAAICISWRLSHARARKQHAILPSSFAHSLNERARRANVVAVRAVCVAVVVEVDRGQENDFCANALFALPFIFSGDASARAILMDKCAHQNINPVVAPNPIVL